MKTITKAMLAGAILASLSACTTTDPCSRIVEMKELAQRCDMMRRNMDKLKSNPQMMSAAKQRYEQECVDFLYYRDDFTNDELKCLSEDEKKALPSRRKKP
ncbi:hypothetical protein PVT67_06390 [Gallaecimonas kandeliae]|uniref:hypothetical protein n=1 Tax=Gallaecimonas kandeliae TaxID=3029055 RepID=UPI002648C208|nr:hypothetical protein [Gallaecimonas kandeliae]WKE66862.1 hypothetical protein PVT67_06390 [Gallaecimonas kandeliae]